MSKLTPLHQYAKDKGLSKQAVYASKTLPIVELNIYARYGKRFVPIGKQKFVAE